MGEGRSFRCNQCGHTESASFGIGFGFPQLYQDVAGKICKGKYGRDWKQLFETVPGAAVEAGMQLYVCPECGTCEEDLNLSLYEPVNPEASRRNGRIFSTVNPAEDIVYVMPHELAADYKCLKVYVHKCHACGTRMHQYRDGERLVCTKCRKGEMEPAGEFMWD